MKTGRAAWVQVASGSVDANGQSLQAGDGLAVRDVREVTVRGLGAESEFVLFDVAA